MTSFPRRSLPGEGRGRRESRSIGKVDKGRLGGGRKGEKEVGKRKSLWRLSGKRQKK